MLHNFALRTRSRSLAPSRAFELAPRHIADGEIHLRRKARGGELRDERGRLDVGQRRDAQLGNDVSEV